jgi:lipopolysaccharide/colanic/teichoic acid biosynthesis glycosyltransferase
MKYPTSTPLSQTPSRAGNHARSGCNRALDIFCCVLALPVLVVGVLLMTIATKLVSPGPVFFRQERVGHRGRRFKIFKFRTMRVNADATVHQDYFKRLIVSNTPMVKLDTLHDARLIPGGWLLRASGLDELPQLINVLCGDMSLVGPRPCIPSEYEQFLPWQRERANAVPGLTGLWQVSGKNRTTFDEMIRLDIHYARHASLPLNLKIIFLTPWAMLVQFRDTRLGRKSSALAVAAVTPRLLLSPVRPIAP